AGYLFCIGLTQNNLEQLLSNRLNGITIGILGWILQFVMWRNFTTITCQQHLLAQANLKLTDRQTELERLVRDDVLTGLPNRLAANERLHTEFVSMKRSNEGYAVLMMDIDFFKRVNDTHGHAVGDQVLRGVAKTMQVTLRESDFAARFGGEEFIALLPFTDLPAALRVAEKLRQAVQSSTDPVAGRITLSIGLSLASPDQASEEVAVREADDALYRAKRDGRNRVQVASELLERVETGNIATDKLLQLVWHASYESGDQTIDAQHRALFRHANKLLQAALDGHPPQELVALIEAFIAEVAQHFQDEEAIITLAGYPGAVEHASLHRALIEKATDLAKRASAGSLGVSELLMYLVQDVLKRHMLTADRKFFPHLQTCH
ncbi:MAG: diguanylate cyclase, partial [Rhodoferax sp.]|nr:diguanylate cyclase [Rhodoferax sp.]